MSADTRNPDINATPGEVAGEAALIATFYSPRGATPTRRLHEHLYLSLAGVQGATAVPENWHDSANEKFLRCFDPPAAHDTTVIQLALNAPGGAASAWETMQRKLETMLNAEDLDGTWGYTITYQAVLNRSVDAEMASKELLPAIRRFHSSEGLHPLASADVPGGRLWLLSVPHRNGGVSAATVYVALGPRNQEKVLIQDLLYGPDGALLMPDLIAHKGYHQMRQYRGGDLERRYEESVDGLRKTTDRVLTDLGRRALKADKLSDLARRYNPLISVVVNLKELYISLVRQSHNYDTWQPRIKGGDVIEFHRDQLETATVELKLKMEELEYALETADKAVSVVQAQLDKVQESRQWQIQTLLALVAVALTLTDMIEGNAAKALLRLLSIPEPANGYNSFLLLGTQFGMILVIVPLVVLTIGLLSKWPKRPT